MTFYEIEFPLGSLDMPGVERALEESGAASITFVDRGDEPILEPRPGEVRLWSDTLVRALFETSGDAPYGGALGKIQALTALMGRHITDTARLRAVEDREWQRVWLTDWKAMSFGRRLWVCPADFAAPDDPDAVVVRLDPGLAFGTGSHPTTALCLQVLDS